MDWTWGWTAVAAIAICVLAGGVFLAVRQQWESRRRARIEYTEKRMETLNTQDVKEGLQIAYWKKPSKLNALKKEEQDKLVHVLELMQALGLLVEVGLADK